jgi:hypothetical protein
VGAGVLVGTAVVAGGAAVVTVVVSVGDASSGATVVEGVTFFLGAGLAFAFALLFVVFRVAAADGADDEAMARKQSATAIMRELRRRITL